MNLIFKIIIILSVILSAGPAFALTEKPAVPKSQVEDAIHLQLEEDAMKNPVQHDEEEEKNSEDVDLEEVEDELPENNAELLKPVKKPRLGIPSEVEDNIEAEFSLFDNFNLDEIFDKNHDNVIDEDTLMGRLYHRKITRTDVPTYLLREELTFRPKKGPVSKMQFYGAYQGSLASGWQGSDYDFNYETGFFQIGALGKFRHTNNDFKILLNPRPRDGLNYMQNFVADAYIINSSIPHHKIVVGYSRNQVGKEGGSSSYILPFVARSQIARTFGNTRALGVRLIGNYSLIDYNFALNSSDRFFRDWFPGTEFTGWVDFKPLGKTDGRYGKLIIGGGLNAGHNKTDYAVGSFYVGYKYKKLWTNMEYAIADGYNGFNISSDKAQGFNYTIGYKIVPQLQLIARYDYFDPNRDIADNNRREYTAGINYFIKGQAVRLIMNYVYCQNDAAPDSHRVIFATQLLL